MVIYVDIDETICHYPTLRKYELAEPIKDRILHINKLYKNGHTVVYWTARGSTTNIDWSTLTKAQLRKWGALHHKLKLGKPYYDLFIDDKAFNSDFYFK